MAKPNFLINEKSPAYKLCSRYGVPLRYYNKYPQLKKWPEKVWGDFTAAETANATGFAVNCGAAGFVVIDIDNKPGGANGHTTWQSLVAGKNNPNTLTVSTPNNGEHRYYRLTEEQRNSGVRISNAVGAAGLGPGLDIRAKGGCVVGPGSEVWLDKDDHSKGKGTYAVTTKAKIADLPDWLFALLTEPSGSKAGQSGGKTKTKKAKSKSKKKGSNSATSSGSLTAKAQKLLQDSFSEAAFAPKGKRNDTLNRQTYKAVVGGVPADVARPKMVSAGMAAGLGADEAEKAVESAIEAAEAEMANKSGGGDEDSKFSPEFFEDGPQGREMAEKIKDRAVWVKEWKSWAVYNHPDGLPWKWMGNATKEATSLVEDELARIYKHVCSVGTNSDKRKARHFLGEKKINAVRDLASNRRIISSCEFNKKTRLFLAKDKVVNMENKEIREPRFDDYMTSSCPAAYIPGKKHEGWDAILSPIPEDCQEYVQILMGAAFTGLRLREHRVHLFYGGGGNGKSAFADVMRAIGGDYGAKPDSEVFLESRQNADHKMMVFQDLRFAFPEELPDARHLNAQAFKTLVGTRTVRASHKYQREEEFEVVATIIINTNYLPPLHDLDRGTWRRLAVLPFPYSFVENPQGPDEKLLDPRVEDWVEDPEVHEAALAWVIDGAAKWFERGRKLPPMPSRMVEATNAWRGNNDKIGQWFEDNIVPNPDCYITVPDLYKSYVAHVEANGQKAQNRTAFLKALENHDVFKAAGLERPVRGDLDIGRHSPYRYFDYRGEEKTSPLPGKPRENLIRGIRFLDDIDNAGESDEPQLNPEESKEKGLSELWRVYRKYDLSREDYLSFADELSAQKAKEEERQARVAAIDPDAEYLDLSDDRETQPEGDEWEFVFPDDDPDFGADFDFGEDDA